MDEEEYLDDSNEDELKNSFAKLLEDLDTKDLVYSNAEDFFNRIKSHTELAEGHISNAMHMMSTEKKKFNTKKKNPAIQEMIDEQKLAPVELLNSLIGIYRNLEEIRVWERMKVDVYSRFLKKIFKAFMSMKSFEINNEVNKGFEKRQEQWMNLTKEMMDNMFSNVDSKIDMTKDRIIAIEHYVNEIDKKFVRVDMILENMKKIQEMSNKNTNSNDFLLENINTQSFSSNMSKRPELKPIAKKPVLSDIDDDSSDDDSDDSMTKDVEYVPTKGK